MKLALFGSAFLLFAKLLSCGSEPIPDNEKHVTPLRLRIDEHDGRRKRGNGNDRDSGDKAFDIKLDGLTFRARVDNLKNVTIHNYPYEWRGKMSLVRFDGTSTTDSPFSTKDCETIRGAASRGFGHLLVRAGFYSLLVFDTPPFLSFDFHSKMMNAAQTLGPGFNFLDVKNKVDTVNAKARLDISHNAITKIIGNIQWLEKELYIERGGYQGTVQRTLTITSGDIICDLIAGDAKLTMIYPIIGEDGVINVVYDALEVNLPKSL